MTERKKCLCFPYCSTKLDLGISLLSLNHIAVAMSACRMGVEVGTRG